MPDTHEDIRRRLFDAAWETPAFAPAPERTVTRARRRAALSVGGGAILLAAVAVTIFTLGGGAPLADKHRTAEDVHGDDPRETLVDTSTGEHSAFDALPSGAWLYDFTRDRSRVAFVQEASGRNQVWIINMDGTGLRQLTHDPLEATDPAWSPDGSRIVYVGFGKGDSRDLFVIDVAGGRPERVMSEPEDPSNPGWSPDASRIVYWSWVETDALSGVSTTSTSIEVRSVNVESGRVSVLAGGKARRGAWDGAWAVRSMRIAFFEARFVMGSGHADHSLWLMDADGSEKEHLLSLDVDDASSTSWSPDGSQIAFVVSRNGGSFVHVFDLDMGEDREIGPGAYVAWADDDTLLVQEFLPDH
jgi:Tol biopolymer transport system component